MALIDVLPAFRYKPLDLTPVETKLVPRADTTKPVVVAETLTSVPVKTPEVPAVSTPVSSQTLAQNLPKQRLVLPDVYKGLTPLAEAVNDSTVVNPKARVAIIAQMGLERGWTPPKDYNYGNITKGSTWSGSTEVRADKDAKGNPITQKFRQYNSSKEFLDDYLSLLKNVYPKAYNELHSDDFNIDRFTSGLVEGKFKYAEAPDYKEKVKSIFNSVDTRINTNK